jgi:VanZ family protein
VKSDGSEPVALRQQLSFYISLENLPMALKFIRATAWFLFAVIIFLTLVPPELRPTTEFPHALEHIAIFLAAGAAFASGYPRREFLIGIASILVTAVLEILQLFDPGRHARFSDFLLDAAGACTGIMIVALFVRALGWQDRSKPIIPG